MVSKMKELITELNNASFLYYNSGNSPLSDIEFDNKLKELQLLEKQTGIILSNSPTINVGAPVLDSMKKVEILFKPMLSLEKVHSEEEIDAFAKGHAILGMIKVDGLSVRLIYENGKLKSANTRGNGYIGNDITEHVKYFTNVPLQIMYSNLLVVDGEAIIKTNDFEIINTNGELKNPRNAAAGTLNLLDMKEVAKRKLSFIAWDSPSLPYDEFTANLSTLELLGFEVVFHTFARDNNLILDRAKELNIPCDGVVWKYNNIDYGNSLGQTSHHFLNGVAWKPVDETYATNLLNIDWTMGRTGQITPVAIFKPIEIDGSVVERANLHNLTVMESILGEPYLDQELEVFKANMIIPQVKNAIKKDWLCNSSDILPINIPTVCPVCGQPLSRVTENSSTVLMCENNACSGKFINQLDHFAGKKGLDIRGLSKATLEKLVDWGWIVSIEDIFNLEKYKKEWVSKPGFGEKSVSNLLQAIENSKECDLDKFICALGIPLIGATAAKDLAKFFHSWAELYNAIRTDFKFYTLPNFGEETHKSIIDFDYSIANNLINNYLIIKDYIETNNINNNLTNKNIVITGRLIISKNRNELKQRIESAGGKVTESISKNTDYLINNDSNSTSNKNLSAKKLNIPILTEEEFISQFLDF